MDESQVTTAASEAQGDCGDVLPVELVILDHYGHQTRRVVRSLPAILGRNDRAEIILTDPWVSHEHCKLVQQEGLLVVCDLGSKNGVFLRGMRVLEAEVHSGDCLTLGRTEITVRYREATCGDDGPCAGETAAPDQPSRPPRPASPHTEELLY
jgi:pSer/pThr/pTyr-binding forkhead associated (FHA) protein